jgi:hypothetical protein
MAATFPLSISADRHYLTDREEKPFFILGDAAWSLISALNREEAEFYLANRAAKGFNAIIVNLVEHKFNGPINRYGEPPFLRPDDISTPNERYFEHADWVLRRASSFGLLVFLAPLFLGYKNHSSDEGWCQEVVNGGAGRCWQFGSYIGKRYTSLQNLVWLIGADRNPAGIEAEMNALVAGIKTSDCHSLFTASPAPEESTSDTFGFGGWLDFNSTYTYQMVHQKLLRDYNHRPKMPFVLLESSYEGEHNASPQQIRRQAYWALLCGATGQFIGNRPVWLFDPGWQQALELPASVDMVLFKRLLDRLPWHTLVPDQYHAFVTSGLGEFNGMDYLAAAFTPDRRLLAVYLPTTRTIQVDLSQIAANSIAVEWFNPRNGELHQHGEIYSNTSRYLHPPGEGDWGLLLHDAAWNL